ncbi:MAG: hypothetical protein SO358_00735, partial [Dialister sp.]|nr:hypothetical protein [Dialister sp.]
MGLRSKRIVIESEAEKSSLQIDEWRELEKRSTKAFFRAGPGVMLIAVQQRSLGCARDDRET